MKDIEQVVARCHRSVRGESCVPDDPAAAQEAVPYGYVFTDDPAEFAIPGGGFHLGPVPPKDAINVVPLYAAPVAAAPVGDDGRPMVLVSQEFKAQAEYDAKISSDASSLLRDNALGLAGSLPAMVGELLNLASTPAAPGIDLRNALLQLREDALHMKDPGDTVNAYNRVLALIDASPKGGSCTTCNDNGLIGGPSFYQPDEGGVPCPDCATNAGVADTQRLDWLESEIRHYGDGQTEPREAYIGFNWQQGNGVKVFPGLRAAIDAEMQATSHGAGVE
ncbi:MAG: hypothetical protein RSG92_15375 [Pseudomonas sp.]